MRRFIVRRRQFITGAVGTALAAAAVLRNDNEADATPIVAKPLNILFLGGTGFIGPQHVKVAVERGHKVAVFNRGKSQADLPPGVERLIGDRNSDLTSIKSRDWDAVVDLQTLHPGWVRTLGQALKGRVKHYTFISSVAAYAETGGDVDESSPGLPQTDKVDPYQQRPATHRQYRSFKILCEQEAEAQFPGRVLSIRPTVIVGPGDPADYMGYWIWRLRQGGEVLAPGDPLSLVQYIDVRDLAEFTISMLERGETGIYNATAPETPLTMIEFLGAVRSMYSVPTRLTWVPSNWLVKQGLKGGEAPLFWVRPAHLVGPDETWLTYKASCKKAVAKGLRFRPLATILQDNLVTYLQRPIERQAKPALGWKVKSEQQLLAEWRSDQNKMLKPAGSI